jgi:quinol monooxygenase YgiN
MILAIYSFQTAPEHIQDLIDVLHSVVGQTTFVPGCINSRIYRCLDQANVCILYEEWEQAADLERHFVSPIFYRILAAMEMCVVEPEVRYINHKVSDGFDWVQKVLNESLFEKSTEL